MLEEKLRKEIAQREFYLNSRIKLREGVVSGIDETLRLMELRLNTLDELNRIIDQEQEAIEYSKVLLEMLKRR